MARAATGWQIPAVAYYVARVLVCLPAGALADRIGKERVLKFSFLLAAVGILVAALWRSSPGLSLRATTELTPPEEYPWPEGLVFVGGDCSLSRPHTGTGTPRWSTRLSVKRLCGLTFVAGAAASQTAATARQNTTAASVVARWLRDLTRVS